MASYSTGQRSSVQPNQGPHGYIQASSVQPAGMGRYMASQNIQQITKSAQAVNGASRSSTTALSEGDAVGNDAYNTANGGYNGGGDQPSEGGGGDRTIPGSSQRNPDGSLKDPGMAEESGSIRGPFLGNGSGGGTGGAGQGAARGLSFGVGASGMSGSSVNRQDYQRQQLESTLMVKEAEAKQKYFDSLAAANTKLANIGPDSKFYKTIEKRLLALDNNPDSVINTQAYKQYKNSLMRSEERRQNAIGRSADSESMIRAESFIRQGYIGELRNFYSNLLGQTTGLKQAGIQGLNQTTSAFLENMPAGQMYGAVNALGQAGRGANDPGAISLLAQVTSTLDKIGKKGNSFGY